MHKLYTTYFAKLKKINFENPTAIAIIMRMPPIAFLNFEGAIHTPELSPSKDVLLGYKRDNDFSKFTELFNEQLETDEDMKKFINFIIECLDAKDGNDICLVCCEKDRDVCHRTLLANYISKITGCEVEEL